MYSVASGLKSVLNSLFAPLVCVCEVSRPPFTWKSTYNFGAMSSAPLNAAKKRIDRIDTTKKPTQKHKSEATFPTNNKSPLYGYPFVSLMRK